jgi:hypothetical protein
MVKKKKPTTKPAVPGVATPRGDRKDPKNNKSLAIRLMVGKMPTAKASEIAKAVKATYGHDVTVNMVYVVKAKKTINADRPARVAGTVRKASSPMTSPALWIDAIKVARQLLKATGTVENATALLKAIDA